MQATERSIWLQQLNEKTAAERVWLNLILISKLTFKNLDINNESLPDDVFMGGDFETAHFLLKEIKRDLKLIQDNTTEKQSLFGLDHADTLFNALEHDLDITIKAFDTINMGFQTQKSTNIMATVLFTGFLVTGIMALTSTIMPWMVPVALFVGIGILGWVSNILEARQFNKANTILNQVKTETSATIKPGVPLPDRNTFFSSKCAINALISIGLEKNDKLKEGFIRAQVIARP